MNKKNKYTKWKPVEKPGDKIMPTCTTCKLRPVSDARKSTCGRCSTSYKGRATIIHQDIDYISGRFSGK